MIHVTPQQYPPKDQFILLWDEINIKWIIACYSEMHGKSFWVTDRKLYYPIEQFRQWTELPEAPKL